MKTIENSSEVKEIVRPVGTLESLCAFRGETLSKMGDITSEEAVRLGVSLVVRGEETKARGVYVLAEKARTMPDASSLEAFRESIKSELVNTAVQRALSSVPGDAKPAQLEKAKQGAIDEATRRFDNLGQTIRAARWVLENPKKVADGVSVFSVQQANAYLDAPNDKAKDSASKEAIRKAVLPLLAKPGTSQGDIKKAVAAVKQKLAKAAEIPDTRTEEKKKSDAHIAQLLSVRNKAVGLLSDWQGLVDSGTNPTELRTILIDPTDAHKGNVSDTIRTLAKLAGLEVK